MKDRADEAEDRLEVDAIFVRVFMTIGIVVWTLAAFSALLNGALAVFYGYAILAAFLASVLIVGWYYARAAAIAMVAAVAALAIWGISGGWDIGIWLLMSALLIVPMTIGVGLFAYAEYEEEVIEHAEQTIPTRAVHA